MITTEWFPMTLAEEITNVDCDVLEQYTKNLISNDPQGRVETNYGGWQSNDLDLSDPIFQPLLKSIYDGLEFMHEQHAIAPNMRPIVQNAWINVNYKGSYNLPHIHPESLFSGVFYVKTPENCGNIVFTHPAQNQQYHFKPETGMMSEYNIRNSGVCFAYPQRGKMILFPSWANHRVEPNNSDEPRISIAFNATFIDQ
jgi:uncharacterized protein (TIGR02466 family)